MDDHEKSREQLASELVEARRRLATLEAAENHRARMQRELQKRESEYRELVEAVSGIILRVDTQGNLTFANRFACAFFGYAKEELLGKNVVGTIVPEVETGGRSMAEHVRDVFEHPEKYRSNENENVRRDGSRVWVAWTNWPVRDENGQVAEILCVGNDISDRKRFEEALRVSRQDWREIYDASTDAVLIHDLEGGCILDANKAMFDMYGYTVEEALRLTVNDISAGEPPYTQRDVEPLWRKAVEEGSQRFEWLAKKKDGRLFWVEVVLQRAVISGHERILALVRDISERKQAERQIEQEQRMLRQLLGSQEHERRLIAYEIHDGLAQQLAAAAMQLQAFDQLRETNHEAALNAHRAGQQALAEGIVETRRLISGLRPLVLDELGVVAAIENLVEETRGQPGPKVEFFSDVQFDRLVPLLENAVFRIVQESLTNASRYSGSNAVRIELVQKQDHLCLEVRDWGVGFDLDKVEAKGYGLDGIRERASLLGGHATIESTLDEGTRIRVSLPLSTPSEDE